MSWMMRVTEALQIVGMRGDTPKRRWLVSEHDCLPWFSSEVRMALVAMLMSGLMLWASLQIEHSAMSWVITGVLLGCGGWVAGRWWPSTPALRRSKLPIPVAVDPLTGALARDVGLRLLRHRSATREGFTLVYADVNGVKPINRLLGHKAGDQFLKAMARKMLSASHSQGGNLIRLEGNKFLMLLPKVHSVEPHWLDYTAKQLRDPLTVMDVQVAGSVSLGVARFPEDARDLDKLIDSAELAMRCAKKERCEQSVYFGPHLAATQRDEAFFQWQGVDHRTVLSKCFVVYQPIYSLTRQSVVSYEALLRHPHMRTCEVIAWATMNGHLNSLFEVVLRHSVDVILRHGCCISVNISPTQLLASSSRILNLLETLMRDCPAVVGKIGIEITESEPILTPSRLGEVIQMLKSLSVKVSVDDFGEGYTSFATLKAASFDVIKVDRSLVTRVDQELGHRALIRSLVEFSALEGMTVVAEGVERQEELDVLRDIGVDFIQGFLIKKPMTVDGLASYHH